MERIRILNKETGDIFYTTVEMPKNFVEIPDDGRLYKWNGQEAVEDIEKEQELQLLKLIEEKSVQATVVYNQAPALFQAIFFNAFQWVSNNVKNPNFVTLAGDVIANYPIPTGLTDEQIVQINEIRQQLLQVIQGV